MKTKNCYLILAAVAGILCVPALGKRANPTLAGIDEFYVFIVLPPDSEPNKDGLVWEELQRKVEHTLKEAGVKYVKPRSLPTPELRIYIDMLKLVDAGKYVFRIQTSLGRTVFLLKRPRLHLPADVWWTKPAMQVVSIEDMPAKVTEVVLHQVNRFIESYLAANQPGTGVSDVNAASVIAATKRAWRAEYKFVASKNSNVFHKPDCSSAKRIKPANLVGYNSRAEALKAGKRPCKRCKP